MKIRTLRFHPLVFLISASLFPASAFTQTQRERRVDFPEQEATQVTSGPQNLRELRSRIQDVLDRPELGAALTGVKIASLDTGRVLFEHNADKLMRPASNMKLYTVAAALDRLGPDFRFKTSVYASAKPDKLGVLHGDLTIYGRGDPTFATRFNNGDYLKGIDALAQRIVTAGVKRVDGDIVGDESYFDGAPFGEGWSWDDLTWYYGAEISALSVDDNSVDVIVKPGARVGGPASITTGPATTLVSIVNHTVTTAAQTRNDINIYKPLGENVIEVSGSVAIGSPGYNGSVAVSHPALLFVSLLKSALNKRGVKTVGNIRIRDSRDRNPQSDTNHAASVEIANLESPPLVVVAAQTLKPSQNLYTELILRALGRAAGATLPRTADSGNTAADLGHNVVNAFLRDAGIDAGSLVLRDASGLSRTDLVTPTTTVQLLTYMSRHKYASQFLDAQPLAGVDGTLRNRFKGTAAENNLRGKTGTLSGVSSLSGYVTSAAGEHLVFSMMLNNFSEGEVSNKNTLDAIGVLLATFKGRS